MTGRLSPDVLGGVQHVAYSTRLAASGELDVGLLPSVPPHGEGEITIPCGSLPRTGRCYLKVVWLLKEDWSVLKAGTELGFDEIELRARPDA